jgi:hypothetical protein
VLTVVDTRTQQTVLKMAMMFECDLTCSPDDCVKCAKAKRVAEGESCALGYNDDGDWFDDEDEEFSFEHSERWFEKAFEDGMAERDEMLNGYLAFDVMFENVESLDGKEKNVETLKNELDKTIEKNE